ncbi:DUF1653 domain-containing protein [Parasporobacterium paucivorans]|uniref:DUF1653 domain-containing protein n=1 Tax=Parasporobacterium paucivorans DSM 15970 TaxID=1122934 RepID=A0A1M6EQE0_9FIRM|nr:DUF1653 domain-containing protein [Parasporobacterium paucivorans]SHI87721.1 Protein of unknown function [Parasporobacterium paucivorans DSM 15970]
MTQDRVPKPGEFYRHFKNKLYQIVTVAIHSETEEKLVVYQALYGDYRIYARPLTMFTGEVDHEKYPDVEQKYRFARVDDIGLPEAEPLETIKETIKETWERSERPIPTLMDFLDAETYTKKRELLLEMRKKIDAKTIDDIAATLDVVIEEGDIQTRYESLLKCLNMMVKFECTRLR